MTPFDEYPPHFRASITFRAVADGGPRQGVFGFPGSGRRNIPLELAGVDGVNTVQLRYHADELVPAGSTIEVECRLLAEELFAGRLNEGTRFGIWDGRIIADGVVSQLHTESWEGRGTS